MLWRALMIVLISALLFVLRAPIADLFDADGEMRDLLYLFCGPLALLFFFNGVLFVSNAAFNNLRRPLFSTFLNWGKNTIGVVPFIAIGASIGGAPGVLIGQSIGGVLFGIVGFWLAYRLVKRYESGDADPDKGMQVPLMRRRAEAPFNSPRS